MLVLLRVKTNLKVLLTLELLNNKFNLSKVPSGTYFINLENKKGTGTKKIILE